MPSDAGLTLTLTSSAAVAVTETDKDKCAAERSNASCSCLAHAHACTATPSCHCRHLSDARTRAKSILMGLGLGGANASKKEEGGKEYFDEEEKEGKEEGEKYRSWVRGTVTLPSRLSASAPCPSKTSDGDDDRRHRPDMRPWRPTARTRFFDSHGFLLVPNFVPRRTDGNGNGNGNGESAGENVVQAMKEEMERLVEERWHPPGARERKSCRNGGDTKDEDDDDEKEERGVTSFRTDDAQLDAQGNDAYFLGSSDKVRFFAEEGALVPDDENEDGKDEDNDDDDDDDDDNDKNDGKDQKDDNESKGTKLNEKHRNKSDTIKTTSKKRVKLKKEFQTNKVAALNKVGHALHSLPSPSTFHSYATSEYVSSLVRELGWTRPVIAQSMYIFKQPRVGGVVTSHQDSTFLYTRPRQSCLGLWLALHDATLANGCLWVRPGSHWEGVRRRFVRVDPTLSLTALSAEIRPHSDGGCKEVGVNFDGEEGKMNGGTKEEQDEEKEEEKKEGNNTNNYKTKPNECINVKMTFESIPNEPSIQTTPWDGSIPTNQIKHASPYEALLDAGFVPIECKAGDLVVFPGTTDHLSLSNESDLERHTFQLHLVEGPGGGGGEGGGESGGDDSVVEKGEENVGIVWDEGNWLQYPPGKEFISI